jgi:hypothetical protein
MTKLAKDKNKIKNFTMKYSISSSISEPYENNKNFTLDRQIYLPTEFISNPIDGKQHNLLLEK